MRKLFSDFKDFISRGKVMNLAIGIIIGSAFTAVVNSLVSDILTPLITGLSSGTEFANMKVAVSTANGIITLTYGNFINALLEFLFIAIIVFILVKIVNSMQQGMEALTKETHETAPHCPFCMEEIKPGATRCPHCTAELPAPAESTFEVIEMPANALTDAWKKAKTKAFGLKDPEEGVPSAKGDASK